VGNSSLAANLTKINAQADLALFSKEKGCDMPMVCPTDEGIFFLEGSTVPVPAVAPYSPPPKPAAAQAPAPVHTPAAVATPPPYSAVATVASPDTPPPVVQTGASPGGAGCVPPT